MARMTVGAQLYTVRKFCKDIEGIKTSLGQVAKIGYTAVQISGFGPADPRQVAKALADTGLAVASTHMAWARYLNDLDAVIEQHRLWKCKHAAIGGLPEEYASADGVKRFLDELAPVAAKLAAAGMDFAYHNHNHELARFGAKTWLAVLYEQADPRVLKAELDTYWLQAGGGDPALWIRKCAGRLPVLHVKDMIVLPDRTLRFAEIGEGNLNWSAILKAASDGGVEYLMVEQDQCYERDPFDSLAISLRNLRAMGVN